MIVYLLYVAVAVVTWALYRTRWGLRVRAVGEHPKAADTVGIKVNRTRYRTILIAGAIAGMGGAFYTLVSVPQFNREMTGGAGYIALAAVIFGKWDPIRATLAALLFGFASNLQGVLSVIGSPVPEPVHADAALRRHDLRRRRPGREVATPGGGRHPLPEGLAASSAGARPAAASASTRAPMRRRALVDAQVALVEVVRRPTGRAGAEAGHRAGDAVEVPAEVLAAQALGRRDQSVRDRAPARRPVPRMPGGLAAR